MLIKTKNFEELRMMPYIYLKLIVDRFEGNCIAPGKTATAAVHLFLCK